MAIRDHRNLVRECPGFQLPVLPRRVAFQRHGRPRHDLEPAGDGDPAAGLLALLDTRYGAAVRAEAQAAAQVASAVNSYFAATDYNEYVHAAVDVVGLAATLAVAQVDPAAAITGVLNVVRDFVDIGVPQPDANALILQGLQGVSKQLSAFAEETAAQFRAVDARLEALTRQVGTLADQLSSQLAEARTQLTGLGTALSDLQSSVDRLHSEIQRLFAEGARNNLRALVSQTIGYSQINGGRRLPRDSQFAPAAAELFDNATATSLSDIVLSSPLGYDAAAAAKIGELDPSINFFALFPQRVTDSPAPAAWPRALTDTCPADNVASGRCLPSPDYWAVSARAFAQLLLENRDYVTPAYLTQLDATLDSGRSLASAFGRIDNNDSNDGTGSRLFNAALGYYGSWVGGRNGDRPSDQPPALIQALRAERERYLKGQRTPGLEPVRGGSTCGRGRANRSGTSISSASSRSRTSFPSSPWGASRSRICGPRRASSAGCRSRCRTPCGSISGRIQVSWQAFWQSPPPQTRATEPSRSACTSATTCRGRRRAGDQLPRLGRGAAPFTPNCSGREDGSSAELTFVTSWKKKEKGCRDFGAEFDAAAGGPSAGGVYKHDDSGFARAAAELDTLVNARLRELQRESLNDLLVDGTTLTQGDMSRATNVLAAAERVEGAQALLKGYVTLGLPQALATDDTLRGLVAGDAANALLRPKRRPSRGAGRRRPGQLVNYLKYTLAPRCRSSTRWSRLASLRQSPSRARARSART